MSAGHLVDPDLDVHRIVRLLQKMLSKYPGYPCPSHHLLLKAMLQRLKWDHANLLLDAPVCKIGQTSPDQTSALPHAFFFSDYHNDQIMRESLQQHDASVQAYA